MSERVVTIFGAGNMRTGPIVMAALARWYPDFPFSIRLFDANSERLDLVDLLLRTFLDSWNSEVPVISTDNHLEAIDGATDLIFTLHEDCARRMLGTSSSAALTYFEDADEMEFYLGGDRNKPTPVAQLSEQTRKLLEAPKRNESREVVLKEVVRSLLGDLPDSVRILNLMRGVSIGGSQALTEMTWPEAVSEEQLTLVPHQILRWVRGDENPFELGELAGKSPVLGWLRECEAG